MGNASRTVVAVTMCFFGANILRIAPRILNESIVATTPFKESAAIFLGWFFIAYGLRVALTGLPSKERVYQLFINAPLMIAGCLAVCRAGVYLIFNNYNTDLLGVASATIGVTMFLGGLFYAITSKWPNTNLPWTAPW